MMECRKASISHALTGKVEKQTMFVCISILQVEQERNNIKWKSNKLYIQRTYYMCILFRKF